MGLLIALIILAIIAAALGFGGVASIAITLFWIFLGLFIIALIIRLITGRWLFS